MGIAAAVYRDETGDVRLIVNTAKAAAMRNEPGMALFMGARRPGEIATVPPVVAEIKYGIRRIDASSRKYTLLLTQKEKLFQVIQAVPQPGY